MWSGQLIRSAIIPSHSGFMCSVWRYSSAADRHNDKIITHRLITGKTSVVHTSDEIALKVILEQLISFIWLTCVSHQIRDLIRVIMEALVSRLVKFSIRCYFR